MVQFQFAPNNHTVTQSTFDAPCQPIAMHSNVTGVYSGFMPVAATAQMTPTYTILINNTTPMWLYCSQGKHCQNGMTMVINEKYVPIIQKLRMEARSRLTNNSTKANASRSLAAFQALAKTQTVNLPGNAVSNGTTGTSNTPESSLGASSSSPSATSSGGATQSTKGSSASAITVSGSLAMGGALAVVMALFV
jgi:hypothetical protein